MGTDKRNSAILDREKSCESLIQTMGKILDIGFLLLRTATIASEFEHSSVQFAMAESRRAIDTVQSLEPFVIHESEAEGLRVRADALKAALTSFESKVPSRKNSKSPRPGDGSA